MLRSHERTLDFRAGTLSRRAEWMSPAGSWVKVTSTRLVSFTQRAVMAVRYEVEPLDGQARISVQSELLANEEMPSPGGDPRAGVELANAFETEYQNSRENAVVLVTRTKGSRLRVGAVMDHLVEGPGVQTDTRAFEEGGLVTATAVLQPGQRLVMTKFVAYGWSSERSLTALRDQNPGPGRAVSRHLDRLLVRGCVHC